MPFLKWTLENPSNKSQNKEILLAKTRTHTTTHKQNKRKVENIKEISERLNRYKKEDTKKLDVIFPTEKKRKTNTNNKIIQKLWSKQQKTKMEKSQSMPNAKNHQSLLNGNNKNLSSVTFHNKMSINHKKKELCDLLKKP